MAKNTQLEEIIYVSWEESERGWGTRPDGCSLHLSKSYYELFLDDYWRSQPDQVQDEYSRPAGKPVMAYAAPSLLRRIENSSLGLRIWEDEEIKLVANKELIYGNERSGWVSAGTK